MSEFHNRTPDHHGETLKALYERASEAGSLAWAIETAARGVRLNQPDAKEALAHALGAGILYLRGL